MGQFISNFNTTAELEAFMQTDEFKKPHVSLTKDSGEVHFIPSETRVVAKFNVTDTSNPTKIGYKQYTSGFSEIEIDGVVQTAVTSAYTFSTAGEHTVKYTLTDPTSIGKAALSACTNLTSAIIPNNVTSIGDNAFEDCSNLTFVTISNNVTTIGKSAFNGCSSLTNIDIPSGVTTIGDTAFYFCSSLTSIVIPSGVTTIGDNTFYFCSSLTSIVIPSGVTTIGDNTFRECGVTSVTIPNSVISIGLNAFYKCTSLTSVTIGSGVTSIGGNAFNVCSSLSSVICYPITPPTLVNNEVFAIPNNYPIYVPSGSVDAYKVATNWSTYADRIQAIP